jgi:hypothetical protein
VNAQPLDFIPPLVRPMRRGTALFLQAGDGAVGLEVGGVDHETVGLAALGRQRGEDLIEHPQTAPADETVVDRLVRAILLRRIAPA